MMMISQNMKWFLRKVLNRFKKDELPKTMKEWGFIDTTHLNLGGVSKNSAVDQILEACMNKKIKLKNVSELDLISAMKRPSSKKWTVYQLTKTPEASSEHDVVNPDELYQELRKQLSNFFKHCLCYRQQNEALWFRVGIQDSQNANAFYLPSNTVLIVHFPHSPYIMLSNIKVAFKDLIMQTLMNSLHCIEIRELKLTGRSLYSLADMVLNRSSQGGFSKYRFSGVDHNPLVAKRGSKRRNPSEDDLDSRIVVENMKEKKRREERNTETFGTHDQPILESIKYSLETIFRGTEFAPAMAARKKPFRCRVKFEGVNVLEGIKELGPAGLASLPLPLHLGSVHSLAKNHFVLADKKCKQNS